jgi:hypothetical protein
MSLPHPDSNEFFDLLFDFREGHLDDARCSQLVDLLEQDELARKRYLEVTQLVADLRWQNLAVPESLVLSRPSVFQPRMLRRAAIRFLKRPAVCSALSAMAAVAAVVAFLALFTKPFDPGVSYPGSPPADLATLVGSLDAKWAAPRFAPYHRVSAGRWTLEAGACSLRLDNGVELIVEGPADFDLQSVGRVRLDRGRLAVRVPEAAHGFCVYTPHAELIDLGTEFGVVVDSADATDVAVYQGRIEVHALASPAATQQLTAQRGASVARIDAHGIASLAAMPVEVMRVLPSAGKNRQTHEHVSRTTREGLGADAFVQGSRRGRDFAGWHYSGEPHLWLKTLHTDLSYTRYVYLRFDLTDLPHAEWRQGRLILTSNYDGDNTGGEWRLHVWGLMEAADAPLWQESGGASGPAPAGALCWNRAPALDSKTGRLRGAEIRQLADVPLAGLVPKGTRLVIPLAEPPFHTAWIEWIQARKGSTGSLILQAVRVGTQANEKTGWSFRSKESGGPPPTLELMGVSQRETIDEPAVP